MNDLDLAWPGVDCNRDVGMSRSAGLYPGKEDTGLETIEERGSVVSWPFHGLHVYTLPGSMGADAFGQTEAAKFVRFMAAGVYTYRPAPGVPPEGPLEPSIFLVTSFRFATGGHDVLVRSQLLRNWRLHPVGVSASGCPYQNPPIDKDNPEQLGYAGVCGGTEQRRLVCGKNLLEPTEGRQKKQRR